MIIPYQSQYAAQAAQVWNEVVRAGNAFPQESCLTPTEADAFFLSQSYTGIWVEGATACGLYILHPNNVGRCGHICNASYAVASAARGRHIGEALVRHCLQQAKALGFRILQFNAVVATNTAALALYQKLGFTKMALIPGGFRMPDGSFADIIPHYITLS